MAIFIGLLLLLSGCSLSGQKQVIHENVDESLALDSVKALGMLGKQARRSKPKYKAADAAFLRDYQDSYGQKNANDDMSSDDYQVYLHVDSLIASFGPDAPIDERGRYLNASHNFKWQQEIITDIIEKGFVLP